VLYPYYTLLIAAGTL